MIGITTVRRGFRDVPETIKMKIVDGAVHLQSEAKIENIIGTVPLVLVAPVVNNVGGLAGLRLHRTQNDYIWKVADVDAKITQYGDTVDDLFLAVK